MMGSFHGLAAVLALVLVVFAVDSTSQAQDRGRGRRGADGFGQRRQGGGPGDFGGRRGGGGADAGSLLRLEQVQTELKLEDDQLAAIEEFGNDMRAQARELFGQLRDLSSEERAAKIEEMRSKRQEMQAAVREKLETVLSTTQLKRLDEITLQVRGMNALADKELGDQLSISDEQRQSIDDILESQRDMQRELFGSLRDLRNLDETERVAKVAEMREKGEELASETSAAVLDILTQEQRTTFEKMKGEPFELDRRALRDGGRGGRGGLRDGGGPGGRRGGDGGRRTNRPQRPESI